MRLAAALVLAVLWACAPCAFAADEFEAGIEQARKGLAGKNAEATLKGMRKAMAGAFKKLPFSVVNVHLLAAQPTGYGRFIPRIDNVYRPSEPLILYMEPVGFTVKEEGEKGLYRFSLTADFNLVDAWGRVVSGRREFGRFGGEGLHFPDRYPLTFTYSLTGLPPGEYKVETILKDRLGGNKTHTVVTRIRIEGH